jgi:hypothetical protein
MRSKYKEEVEEINRKQRKSGLQLTIYSIADQTSEPY